MLKLYSIRDFVMRYEANILRNKSFQRIYLLTSVWSQISLEMNSPVASVPTECALNVDSLLRTVQPRYGIFVF